jgi:hypothetical protein
VTAAVLSNRLERFLRESRGIFQLLDQRDNRIIFL